MNVQKITQTILFCSFFLTVQPADISSWYHERVKQKKSFHIPARVLASGMCGALAYNIAAEPRIVGKALGNVDDSVRGFMAGAVTYALASWLYTKTKKVVVSAMPPFQHDEQFIEFLQHWPAQKHEVMPELHPLGDWLHEQIMQRGVLAWPYPAQVRDGMTLLSSYYTQAQEQRSAVHEHAPLTAVESVSLSTVRMMRRAMRAADVLVPFACGIAIGNDPQAASTPLLIAATYVVGRIIGQQQLRSLTARALREKIEVGVMRYELDPSQLSPATQAVLAPIHAWWKKKGVLPDLIASQIEAICAVLAVSDEQSMTSLERIRSVLDASESDLFSKLHRMYVPRLLALPVFPAVAVAAIYGTGTTPTVGIYALGVAGLISMHLTYERHRVARSRRSRIEHIITHWPLYKEGAPDEVTILLEPLYLEYQSDVNRDPLSDGEVSLLYQQLLG